MIEYVKANMPEHLQPEEAPTGAAKIYNHYVYGYVYGWPKETD
jgi:hypothetical protein